METLAIFLNFGISIDAFGSEMEGCLA